MPQQNQGGEAGSIASDVVEKPHPHAPHVKAGSKVVVPIDVFCAACQAVTPHQSSRIRDRNNHHEIVCTCDCGAFLKFPITDDPAKFRAMLDANHKSNAGQISAEMAEAEAAAHDERFLKMLGVKSEKKG